ncbi:DUF4830 domain-containing protein [Romboutsia lituseburensis]|uniref:DUF4830 domain-containing protein n=1 Tax=Romboutsia lituseburensis TaxID=1537 RepID=UPI00215AD5A6|nr:DUF4830 domain-containing protein [Romboutsia lituseburensis]MCR8744685.1 DUF4830 domain-containing protein [Romboutsia lituseburensis]
MKNLKNKKNATIVIICFVVLTIAGIYLTNPKLFKSDKDKSLNSIENKVYPNQSNDYKDLIEKLKSTNKIGIYHDYHAESVDKIKPIYIKDKYIINDYLNLMSKNVKKSSEEMSGGSVKNQKLVFYTDNETIEVNYSYDDLDNFGFITYKGEDIYLDYDFFRLISNTQGYSPKESSIDEDAKKLLKRYNWRPSFLIANHKIKISDDLNYAPEKGIDEVYWAYNLQFSKSIGLDFSNLLGEEVNAEVYYLLEPLPDACTPTVDAKAVVLKHNKKIVGAYIDSGILNRAICSLDRKSFKEITGLTIEDYLIQNHIDKNSKLNKEVENLSTEELIKSYYKSQSDNDVNKYLSTLDMGAIISLLDPDEFDIQAELFNTLDKNNTIFKHANETEVLKVKENGESSGMKDVNIKLNILKCNQITIDKGIYDMVVNMRKNENGVYKINSVGF